MDITAERLPIERTWAFARVKSVKSYMHRSRPLGNGTYEYFVRIPGLTTKVMDRYGILYSVTQVSPKMHRIVWSIPKELMVGQ